LLSFPAPQQTLWFSLLLFLFVFLFLRFFLSYFYFILFYFFYLFPQKRKVKHSSLFIGRAKERELFFFLFLLFLFCRCFFLLMLRPVLKQANQFLLFTTFFFFANRILSALRSFFFPSLFLLSFCLSPASLSFITKKENRSISIFAGPVRTFWSRALLCISSSLLLRITILYLTFPFMTYLSFDMNIHI